MANVFSTYSMNILNNAFLKDSLVVIGKLKNNNAERLNKNCSSHLPEPCNALKPPLGAASRRKAQVALADHRNIATLPAGPPCHWIPPQSFAGTDLSHC